MICRTCAAPTKEIAAKTTSRGPDGFTKCHRLECGHAWHVTAAKIGAPLVDETAPTPCGCGELVVMNGLLFAGRQLARVEDLSDEAFREWSKQVLEALDGIPAESGDLSLVRRAATTAKSPTSSTPKKVADLSAILVRAIAAVS